MVSGANRGIGLAIARRLAGDGYRLSLGARDTEALEKVVGDLDAARTMRTHFDAADLSGAQRWTDATLARFGRLDALVNNAGILRMVNYEQGGEAELDAMWQVNVKAPFMLTRAALPHLRRAGNGRIVNIASTDAKRFRDYTVSIGYSMSKHALLAMSHAAKFAGWEDGVRVTALCPGAVDTNLIAGVPGTTPPGKRLKPETVAATVAFLLTLPNEAIVAELPINARLESTL
jgi:NAD(P)-dependent dehydrogenase (short-subunit alcohol dehydrogenase family)